MSKKTLLMGFGFSLVVLACASAFIPISTKTMGLDEYIYWDSVDVACPAVVTFPAESQTIRVSAILGQSENEVLEQNIDKCVAPKKIVLKTYLW